MGVGGLNSIVLYARLQGGYTLFTRIEMAKEMNKVSVMMLGDSTVGKTSIVLQYCEQKFSADIKSTVGEYYNRYIL